MDAFSEKVSLLIIDKLLIAGILVLLGYFVNKTLETYKSRNSLINDITKQRFDKISELNYKIADFEKNIYEEKMKGLEIQLRRIMINDIRKSTDNDIKNYKGNQKLIDELKELFQKHKTKIEKEISSLEDEIKALNSERDTIFDSLNLTLSKYRFWLGKELTDKYNTLLNEIIDGIALEFKEVDDIKEYEKNLAELDAKRIDVLNLLGITKK